MGETESGKQQNQRKSVKLLPLWARRKEENNKISGNPRDYCLYGRDGKRKTTKPVKNSEIVASLGETGRTNGVTQRKLCFLHIIETNGEKKKHEANVIKRNNKHCFIVPVIV